MKNLILKNLLLLMVENLKAEQQNHPDHSPAIQNIIDSIHVLIKSLEKKPARKLGRDSNTRGASIAHKK